MIGIYLSQKLINEKDTLFIETMVNRFTDAYMRY